MDRRDFLNHSSLIALGSFGGAVAPESLSVLDRLVRSVDNQPADALAQDEAFWMNIRKSFVTSPDLVDLDNANTAPTPARVFNAYVARGQRLRQAPSESFNKTWEDVDKITRPELASFLGARREEVCFTPNATYGLNTILHGFPLERGDEIIVTDHEYPDMIETISQRGKREGIVMKTVNVPLPGEDRLALVNRIEQAITPRTKLLLISHVSAWSGEVLPIDEVTAVAHKHDVAVLVDGAQSVGLLDVNFDRIGADFLATSLHKWMEAPMGTGALLMKTKYIGKVWPLNPPAWDTTTYPMDPYEWCGTFNVAAYRSISDAIKFQQLLGLPRKRARIRFLGDYWQKQLADIRGVHILTPHDASRSFGVAAFMFDQIQADKAVKILRAKGFIVQDKSWRHSPFKNAIRVSPGVYATTSELDRFVKAVKQVASAATV